MKTERIAKSGFGVSVANIMLSNEMLKRKSKVGKTHPEIYMRGLESFEAEKSQKKAA